MLKCTIVDQAQLYFGQWQECLVFSVHQNYTQAPQLSVLLIFRPFRWISGVHRPFNVALITSAPAALPHDNQSPGTPSTLLSHANVAETSWEDLREGRRSDCAFRRDFNDNVADVAMFAANNNTSRLLEGKEKSNNSDSTHAHTNALIDNTVYQHTETWHSTTLPCFFFFF